MTTIAKFIEFRNTVLELLETQHPELKGRGNVISQLEWVDGELVSCTTLSYDLGQTQRYIDLEGPKEPILLTTYIADAVIEHVSI